jgi:NTE family protein
MFGQTRMEDLSVPFFCVSSNLNTARSVVHETGRLWHAVRSSCSVPGLVPPVRSRGDYLVDGGLLDNLPVDAMRQRLAGKVIASDVSVAIDPMQPPDPSRLRWLGPLGPPTRMPGIVCILTRTAQLASVRDSRVAGVPADLYLNPPLGDLGMSDFGRLDEIVERSASYARRQLAEWKHE